VVVQVRWCGGKVLRLLSKAFCGKGAALSTRQLERVPACSYMGVRLHELAF